MSAHPHADKMLQYAHDAQKTDKPWLLWEWRRGGIIFAPCNGSPHWDETSEYRRKPETIEVNGFTVPAPLRVAPAEGVTVFIVSPAGPDWGVRSPWCGGTPLQQRALERGLVHGTWEGMVARSKAMCHVDPEAPE